MENKVWVVFLEDIVEGCLEDRTIDIFNDEDKARLHFKELVDKYNKMIEDQEDMIIDNDNDDVFSASEEGYYCENHILIEIYPSEVK